MLGCLSNVRFADDVLVMASSLKQLKNARGFQEGTEAHVLEIHPRKTKILTHQKANKLTKIEIGETHVEILPPEGKLKYLGQMITFVGQETTEAGIRCAWSAFTKHR